MASATTSGLSKHGARGAGIFRRTFEAMMGARERQARRYVAGYLLTLDDETLARLGHDRNLLKAERTAIYPF